MKIPDRLVMRLPTPVTFLGAAALALSACDKGPVEWLGDARQVAMPPSGDEGSAPVDAHLVLLADGAPALESITAVSSTPSDSAACAGSFRVSALSRTEIYTIRFRES